ncbi:hypothetical protein KM043_013276 [Ampulex compressa]|nr:hypothetical protein KM043_013276 [Ampulex compressa]
MIRWNVGGDLGVEEMVISLLKTELYYENEAEGGPRCLHEEYSLDLLFRTELCYVNEGVKRDERKETDGVCAKEIAVSCLRRARRIGKIMN